MTLTPVPRAFALNLLDLQSAINRLFENGLISLWLPDGL